MHQNPEVGWSTHAGLRTRGPPADTGNVCDADGVQTSSLRWWLLTSSLAFRRQLKGSQEAGQDHWAAKMRSTVSFMVKLTHVQERSPAGFFRSCCLLI